MASLDSCRQELDSILAELKHIEEGVRTQFSGIGQEHCADCIAAVIRKYQKIQRDLYNVNTNILAESFYGNGSGGGGAW